MRITATEEVVSTTRTRRLSGAPLLLVIAASMAVVFAVVLLYHLANRQVVTWPYAYSTKAR